MTLQLKEFLKKNTNGKFQSGHVPANKGKKMDPELKERIKHTFFQEGHLPENTLHDGVITIRKRKNGRMKFIRLKQGKWQELQRYNWEKKYGTIAKAMVLACKTEDNLNCDPSNWELRTKKEHLAANRRIMREKFIFTCPICGKEFHPYVKNQIHCSAKCYQVHYRIQKKKYHKKTYQPKIISEKKCVFCGKNFLPNGRQKYCSLECRKAVLKKYCKSYKAANPEKFKPKPQLHKKPVTLKNCAWCKTVFEPKHFASKCCSEECSKNLERARNARYEREKRRKKKLNGKPVDARIDNTAVDDMPVLNRANKNIDAERLRKRGIKSPDISEMKFRVFDPKMRITRFFRTREKYEKYLEKNTS